MASWERWERIGLTFEAILKTAMAGLSNSNPVIYSSQGIKPLLLSIETNIQLIRELLSCEDVMAARLREKMEKKIHEAQGPILESLGPREEDMITSCARLREEAEGLIDRGERQLHSSDRFSQVSEVYRKKAGELITEAREKMKKLHGLYEALENAHASEKH